MELNIAVDVERWKEVTNLGQIAMEDYQRGKEASRRGLLDLIAPFLQDKDGNWLEYDDAIEMLLTIKNKDMLTVVGQFNDACMELAVPKGTGNGSGLPSTTAEKDQPG